MSIVKIDGRDYDVKLNSMFIQPHIIINDVTTDIGMWDDVTKEEQDSLLSSAAKCYEFNVSNNTVVDSWSHIHKSEELVTDTKKETKKRWWSF